MTIHEVPAEDEHVAQRLSMRRGVTSLKEERAAVAELHQQMGQPDAKLLLFYCTPVYDLDLLGKELQRSFAAPILGCTCPGQLNEQGFGRAGITALSLAGDIEAELYPILDLDACEVRAADIAARISLASHGRQPPAFGLMLVDGLSLAEERLTASLYQALGHMPIVGGSAGDDLSFRGTYVYCEGRFLRGAAVFATVRTTLPHTTFKFEHFATTSSYLVVTDSDPHHRILRELNGAPAAEAYARALGLRVEDLDSQVFSHHPLVLELGGGQYLRSVRSVNADRSMTLFCAIEDGVVLSLGRAVDPASAARLAFQSVREKIGPIQLTIGFDCVLRRLQFEAECVIGELGALMVENQVFGFSTYGEQFNALHINQTFTGVAIGC